MVSSLQTNPLQFTNDDELYNLYLAALEWDLIEPIVIKDKNDIKSEKFWQDKLEPYDHQVSNLITFCRRLPVTLLADDVGLGKTISAGLIMSELMSRKRIRRILIVCPKILIPQWGEELKSKFAIKSIEAIGKELLDIDYSSNNSFAVITTYQSAKTYLDALSKSGFDMLVLDEAHKLRNLYGVKDAPQVAKAFYKVLEQRAFKFVLMLTATPIQNRYWDLYSLVDLLTVARGHQNPFGNEDTFYKNFIQDNRTDARKLKYGKEAEFRSIVYGYMSRIRRIDANLDFPERNVQLHRVAPTPEELELIEAIRIPIQSFNPLVQVSILQALTSSPEALSRQLENSAMKDDTYRDLSDKVKEIVSRIDKTAKLNGLSILIQNLIEKNPNDWRVVIFTSRIETQMRIREFLESQGISCRIINGNTGSRNSETIAQFKSEPPEAHVIISTEAGSEGVNLQVANVLVNYDLPWNPMKVEQRIGRIQRLASKHSTVSIFNIILKGTFEEYIVGRLMEKLQMATQAIGDIESLLEASGLSQNEDTDDFEELIRKLVVDSLQGKNMEVAMQKQLESITKAKATLEKEKENIESMLGGMVQTRFDNELPNLPENAKRLDPKKFVINSFKKLGAIIEPDEKDTYRLNYNKKVEYIAFDENIENVSIYLPGNNNFEELVKTFTKNAYHQIVDLDGKVQLLLNPLIEKWVNEFGGKYEKGTIAKIYQCFQGECIVRARATVAQDSYERLVSIPCSSEDHRLLMKGSYGLNPIENIVEDLTHTGLNTDTLKVRALEDKGIAEFSRFYEERRIEELKSSGNDPVKYNKLDNDFTTRVIVNVVGAKGQVYREVELKINFLIDNIPYSSAIIVTPSQNSVRSLSNLVQCEVTGLFYPEECIGISSISNKKVLKNLLSKSELSNRYGLEDEIVSCSVTHKKILRDEASISSITGKIISKDLAKKSALSGNVAEPELFVVCEFTGDEILKTEAVKSEISNKLFRGDQQLKSAVSNKIGHISEFVFTSEGNKPISKDESEVCEITGKIVKKGQLEECEITHKKVIASELYKSSVSGIKALKSLFVKSSISNAQLLDSEAIKSSTGKYCIPLEGKDCMWSGVRYHPEDLRICNLTGITVHFQYIDQGVFEPLVKLMDGIIRKADRPELWQIILTNLPKELNRKKCTIENVELSPDSKKLAVTLIVKSLMGLKKTDVGFIYIIDENLVLGKVVN